MEAIKNKKSQLTVFIILALVLIIIFGFLFYVSNTALKIKTLKKAGKAQSDIFTTTPIKYYISTCLDDSLKSGLLLIGRQGGFIYNNTYGGIIKRDVPTANFSNGNISYKILAPNFKDPVYDLGNRIIEDPQYYPCYAKKYGDTMYSLDSYGPYSNIREYSGEKCHKNLNLSMVPNIEIGKIDPFPLNICQENTGLITYKCSCRVKKFCDFSIESQLKMFIINQTNECVNLSALPGYNVTKGIPRVRNLSITNSQVMVDLDFPFTINVKGLPPETKVANFFSTQPIRILDIYKVIYGTNNENEGILYNEFKNITFDLKRDGQRIANTKKDFRIDVIKYSNIKNTTIFNITDLSEKNKLDDESYYFQFAIQNRPPVIEYYKDNPCEVKGVKYDVCINKTENLIIRPNVYDFDEDITYVNYTGWKSPSKWQNSIYYNDSAFCVIPQLGPMAKTCANLFPINSTSDIGPHNITITARDNQSYDGQNISIFVNDIPAPTITSGLDPSCTSASGHFIPWAASNGFRIFDVTAFCGDPDKTGPFTYEWITSNPIGTYTIEMDDCEYIQTFSDFINPNYIFINSPSNIRLKVIDGLGAAMESSIETITFYPDGDKDKYCFFPGGGANNDCNDANPKVFPGNPNSYCDCNHPNYPHSEICDDHIDNDCDGQIDEHCS